MNIANNFKQFIHTILDFLFPRKCLGCGQSSTWLCPACLGRLPNSYSPIEDRIFSVFEYGTPVMKQVIWRLKYKRSLELAETLARPMYETLLAELEDELIMPNLSKSNFKGPRSSTSISPTIILIPAPLSPARYRSRGYNQAEELAKQIALLNPDQFVVRTDIIKKVKDTPTQVSIRNRESRLANLKNAFALCEVGLRAHLKYDFLQGSTSPFSPPDLKCACLSGRQARGVAGVANSPQGSTLRSSIFVIIDDVSTTGATIDEIRSLLTSAGCRHVYGLVIAHG